VEALITKKVKLNDEWNGIEAPTERGVGTNEHALGRAKHLVTKILRILVIVVLGFSPALAQAPR
jgi:hypothetical protein